MSSFFMQTSHNGDSIDFTLHSVRDEGLYAFERGSVYEHGRRATRGDQEMDAEARRLSRSNHCKLAEGRRISHQHQGLPIRFIAFYAKKRSCARLRGAVVGVGLSADSERLGVSGGATGCLDVQNNLRTPSALRALHLEQMHRHGLHVHEQLVLLLVELLSAKRRRAVRLVYLVYRYLAEQEKLR